MRADRYEIEPILDRLLEAKSTAVTRGIDAGACRTRTDFDAYYAAVEDLDDAYDAAIQEIQALVVTYARIRAPRSA